MHAWGSNVFIVNVAVVLVFIAVLAFQGLGRAAAHRARLVRVNLIVARGRDDIAPHEAAARCDAR